MTSLSSPATTPPAMRPTGVVTWLTGRIPLPFRRWTRRTLSIRLMEVSRGFPSMGRAAMAPWTTRAAICGAYLSRMCTRTPSISVLLQPTPRDRLWMTYAGHTTEAISDPFTVQNPATGLLASDPDDVHEGIDGRDFHLTWTPSDAADAVSQDIYIVPTGTDLSTGSQAAAKSFADTTTTSWTGTAADDVTTDATGAEFDPYEDYKLYVVTTDDDGDSSISAGAEWTSEVPNPVLDISFSDPDDSTIGVTGEDFSPV